MRVTNVSPSGGYSCNQIPLGERVRAWARTNADGNISAAVRELIARGLDPASYVEGSLDEMDKRMDACLERVVKASAKGAKASLGSLYLLSCFLEPNAESLRATGDHVIEGARLSEWDDEDSHTWPLQDLQRFQDADAEVMYAHAWRVGSALMRPGAPPSPKDARRLVSRAEPGKKGPGR